jgi:hypothetical protein
LSLLARRIIIDRRNRSVHDEVHHDVEEPAVLRVTDSISDDRVLKDWRIRKSGEHLFNLSDAFSRRSEERVVFASEDEVVLVSAKVRVLRLRNIFPRRVVRPGRNAELATNCVGKLAIGDVVDHTTSLTVAGNIDVCRGNAIVVDLVLDQGGDILAGDIELVHVVRAWIGEAIVAAGNRARIGSFFVGAVPDVTVLGRSREDDLHTINTFTEVAGLEEVGLAFSAPASTVQVDDDLRVFIALLLPGFDNIHVLSSGRDRERRFREIVGVR